jgi:monothiol glutaredoxin
MKRSLRLLISTGPESILGVFEAPPAVGARRWIMSDPERNPFQIASAEPVPAGGTAYREQDPAGQPLERIDRMVASSDVFLFIKGTPQQPLCGFSANTVAVMDALGLRYSSFDVLSDESIRAAAKEYSRWPTFPQVYLRGEFIGGNDIVTEMFHNGELGRMIEGGGA